MSIINQLQFYSNNTCLFLPFRVWTFRWRMFVFGPSCHHIVSVSQWQRATWRWRMEANGSRYVMMSGLRWTAGSSAVCSAFRETSDTIPVCTSECSLSLQLSCLLCRYSFRIHPIEFLCIKAKVTLLTWKKCKIIVFYMDVLHLW